MDITPDYSMLVKIRMEVNERAVVRVKTGPDEWYYLIWHASQDVEPLPVEFGDKLIVSPLSISRQAYSVNNGAKEYEAWIFQKDDYEAAVLDVVMTLEPSPRRKPKPVKVWWWQRLLASFA